MRQSFLLFFFLCSFAFPCLAQTIEGKVIAVADGDTLTILTDAKDQIKIRLSEIDAPEKKQPFGNKAKQLLSELAFGKTAKVVVDKKDRYQRTLGTVFVDEVNVNAEMVKQGLAWHYKYFSSNAELAELEAEAKAQKKGFWALPEEEIIPAWEFRRKKSK